MPGESSDGDPFEGESPDGESSEGEWPDGVSSAGVRPDGVSPREIGAPTRHGAVADTDRWPSATSSRWAEPSFTSTRRAAACARTSESVIFWVGSPSERRTESSEAGRSAASLPSRLRETLECELSMSVTAPPPEVTDSTAGR